MALAYQDNSLLRVVGMMGEGDPNKELIEDLAERVNEVRVEQLRFQVWCDRADKLYYAEDFTTGGADLWADHPSAKIEGRAHVSVNTPAAYVDIPAALQAVTPVENMLATDTTKEARTAASATERIYAAWKAEEDFELKFNQACTVKALYGRTAGFVYWDRDEKRPCVRIVSQPRNLWMDYATDSYDKVDWAAYVERKAPTTIAEEFGVQIGEIETDEGQRMPWVLPADGPATQTSRSWLNHWGGCKVEVWDYWYRKPLFKNGKFVRMETWNVTIAGNAIVRGPVAYPEYEGVIPYVPLFNTYIPGVPDGRAELYDMEPIIREKFEKITNGSQMIGEATAGDYWQLVGPESPSRVPPGLKPERNKMVAPGAGNRIEPIQKFVIQFQLEQFLARLDREGAVVSGLNDLLLGLAPAQVLSSSKAINALIANYETRIAMRRMLLYTWRRNTWKLAWRIWTKKDQTVRSVDRAGGGTLDIVDPSLSPRDEMETATRAANLVASKLWSQRRGMDAVHVDDPETEQDMIREESTDATLFPDRVEVMAQLMSVLQSIGLQPNMATQNVAQGQVGSNADSLRRALAGATAQNTTSSQLPGDQGITPPIEGAGPNEGGAQPPFAQVPPGNTPPQQGQTAQLQTLIQGGQAKGRILTQRQIGRR